MKQLFLVLTVLVLSCAKKEVKPTPAPNPGPTGTLAMFQLDCDRGFEASFNWDSDPEIDTVITSQYPKNIQWKKRGQGRKPKYKGPSSTITFRVPDSHREALKKIVRDFLKGLIST